MTQICSAFLKYSFGIFLDLLKVLESSQDRNRILSGEIGWKDSFFCLQWELAPAAVSWPVVSAWQQVCATCLLSAHTDINQTTRWEDTRGEGKEEYIHKTFICHLIELLLLVLKGHSILWYWEHLYKYMVISSVKLQDVERILNSRAPEDKRNVKYHHIVFQKSRFTTQAEVNYFILNQVSLCCRANSSIITSLRACTKVQETTNFLLPYRKGVLFFQWKYSFFLSNVTWR